MVADIYEEMMALCADMPRSLPGPRFYEACRTELLASWRILAEDSVVLRCLDIVYNNPHDNFGHGLDHAKKVAVEAGALALAEQARVRMNNVGEDRIAMLAQLAGLLHDLCRGEKDHAKKAAVASQHILDDFPIYQEEKSYIIEAIANHEAFIEPTISSTAHGQIISDVLYDADKFRWGPDNFTRTLWEMLRSRPIPMAVVISHFPEGMAGIARITGTFRSFSGKSFGPQFIDLGLQLGEKVYRYLKERFADEIAE